MVKVIAKDIIAEAILLNNYEFFIDRINQSTGNAVKLIDSICLDAVPIITRGIGKLKTEIKKDFSQLSNDKLNKRELIQIEDVKKEKPKIEPSRMWSLHKSFVQTLREKAKEFIGYMNDIFGTLQAIKVRFKQFNLNKYEAMLRDIVITAINKIKEAQ